MYRPGGQISRGNHKGCPYGAMRCRLLRYPVCDGRGGFVVQWDAPLACAGNGGPWGAASLRA